MRKDRWKEQLNAFKGKERPEAVLMLAGAGQDELMRIAVAWKQTDDNPTGKHRQYHRPSRLRRAATTPPITYSKSCMDNPAW